MVEKKRKSKRLSTRKKNKIMKKIKKQEKDRRKENRLKSKSKRKVPKHVLMTDEEIQHIKDIKEKEKARQSLIIENESSLDKFIKSHDYFVAVVDPRDIFSFPNHTAFNEKQVCIVLNYKNNIPIDLLLQIHVDFSKNHSCFVTTKYPLNETFTGFNNDFIDFMNKNNQSIGIVGESKVGKNFVKKLIGKGQIYSLEPKQNASSLLRSSLSMRNVLYKDMLKNLVELHLNKEKLSLLFAIQQFETFDDFVKLIIEKKRVNEEQACKLLLDKFYNKDIMFYYDRNKSLHLIYQ